MQNQVIHVSGKPLPGQTPYVVTTHLVIGHESSVTHPYFHPGSSSSCPAHPSLPRTAEAAEAAQPPTPASLLLQPLKLPSLLPQPPSCYSH